MSFKERVIRFVKKIPKGKVVSYGQVAAGVGSPKAPRQVGGVLKALDIHTQQIPWWRVVNNQGLISIKGNWTVTKELQKDMLQKDGIWVDKNYKVEIEKYRWKNK